MLRNFRLYINISLNLRDLDNIKIFGSITYYKLNNIKDKFQPKAFKAILIGYRKDNKIYKIYCLTNKKALWIRDIQILENQFINNSNIINNNNSNELNNNSNNELINNKIKNTY